MILADQQQKFVQRGTVLDRDKSTLHDSQAEKQNAQPENDFAELRPPSIRAEKLKTAANTYSRQREMTYIKGQQLSGDGCTNIGSEQHAESLGNRHETSIDKSHHHHGSSVRGLHDSGYCRASKYAHQAVIGQSVKEVPQAIAGDLLQRLRHDFHAEQQKTKTAD